MKFRFIKRIPRSFFLVSGVLAGWIALNSLLISSPPESPESFNGVGFALSRDRQAVIHVSGEPYAMGLYKAKGVPGRIVQAEDEWFERLLAVGKTPGRAQLINALLPVYMHGLDDHLTEAERIEIKGLADAQKDAFTYLGDNYGRFLRYQFAPDLLQREFLVAQRSSTIAVSSVRNSNQNTLLARNYSSSNASSLYSRPLIQAAQPSDGFGFVGIADSTGVGVVSGMNEYGLSVVINQGASQDHRRVGIPAALLVRRVLEQARDVAEAVELVTSSITMATHVFVMADAGGKTVAVELTPLQFRVRQGPVVVATNHLEADAFADDPVNNQVKRMTTSVPRRQRLESIVRDLPAVVGVSDLLGVLRDRRNVSDTPLAPTHGHAVDAFFAEHSIIFDATAKIVWVGQGPNTLGAYSGYDVIKMIYAKSPAELKKSFLGELPADPLLSVAGVIERSRHLWSDVEYHLNLGDLNAAERALEDTRALSEHPITLGLRGRLAEARKEYRWAQRFYQQALASPPDDPSQIPRLQQALYRLEKHN